MYYLLAVELLLYSAVIILIRYSYFRFVFFLHMAQLNGYKTNEFWSWIKQNWAKHIVPSEFMYLYILLGIHLMAYKYFTLTAHTIVLSIAVWWWFFSTKLYRQKQKKTLVFTPRMTRQSITTFILTIPISIWGYLTADSLTNELFHPTFLIAGVTASGFIIPITVLFAGFINKPIEINIQNGFKAKASKKVSSMSDLQVIGITGSYGKTSTKFMLRDVLGERFNVLATPGSYNTPMGVCKVINEDLNTSHQLLILEMGARYKGNIKELCEIAAPDIAVVTNVGKAHLETFGSQQAIAETKSEMVQNMAAGGVCFLNANDDLVMGMANFTTSKVISAGLEKGDYQASTIEYDENGCSFQFTTPIHESIRISMPLLGAHNVQNMVLAAAVGHFLGLRLETIALAAKSMKPVEHRLEMKNQNGIIIIDDAFNSNPIGAKNAVDILARFKSGNRILITPGMVELGEMEWQENYLFGKEIGLKNLEKVIFVGKKRSEPLVKGYLEAGGNETSMFVVQTLFEANEFIRPDLKQGDVVLYENDLPDSYNE